MQRPIRRALISVSDKTGLEPFAAFLKSQSVEVISTGGTAKALRSYGLNVTDISDYTGFPEMLDGRVKTLHPLVHGGLLGRPDMPDHKQAMDAHHIKPIDLVVVNLYPFEETVAKGAPFEECVENIDIGGPSMIRSAAKNHECVTVVVDPADYSRVQDDMRAGNGSVSLNLRKMLAAKAFSRTASYDAAIGAWFMTEQGETFPPSITLAATRKQVLRYGENSHQNAALYVKNAHAVGIGTAEQLQGKELSYNNILDADAALELVADFKEPTAAIIKHTNPCGLASASTLLTAYEKALSGDPVSAFGGIVAFNRELDARTAAAVGQLFLEVIIAPSISNEAKALLATKKNLRVLITGGLPNPSERSLLVKTIRGGLLVQERDSEAVVSGDLQVVTKRAPTDKELQDMLFAFAVCKHVKSNAIVLAKDQTVLGVGAGQMSRVDSVRIASMKAADCKENPTRAQGAVVASDAFFPFADGLLLAVEAGITAAIQPGGSIRDEEVIKAADAHNIAMVFTHKRHFKH